MLAKFAHTGADGPHMQPCKSGPISTGVHVCFDHFYVKMTEKAQNSVDLGPETEILLDAIVFAAASILLCIKAAGKTAGDSGRPVWSI